jgi:hypothetical protein
MYRFEDEFVLMAIGSNAGAYVVLVDEGTYTGSPLMDSLALKPKFIDRGSMSNSAAVVTHDRFMSDIKLGFGHGKKGCCFAALVLCVVMELSGCFVDVYVQLSF